MTRPAWLAPLAARWSALAPRERALVGAALALIGLALLWVTALAPAWRTVRDAQSRHGALQSRMDQMLQLQAQARQLQALPRVSREEAVRWLDQSVKTRLGAASQFTVIGDRANVTLRGTSAEALAAWVGQARANARLVPLEAQLNRTGAGPATAWDGTIVLALPTR